MSVVLLVMGLAAMASLVYRVLGVRAVGQLLESAPASPPSPPAGVALLRPLCGAPTYLEAGLESLWAAAATAGVPIRIGIEDPADPAHKEVTRLREAHPEIDIVVHSGQAGRGANRKSANLAQIELDPGAELLILSDADIVVPLDYVARSAAPFADATVGASTAPYRSVPATTLSSRFDALLTNFHFLPSTCVAVRFEGLKFGLGATLALRREALDAIGGFAAILDESGDDLALAHAVQERGWRLAWLPMVVDHLLADVGIRAVWDRHLRCARITRANRFAGFFGLVFITHGWLLALLASAPAGGLAWLAPLSWWIVAGLAQLRHRRALGIEVRDVLLGPLVDLLGLGVMLVALGGRPTPPEGPGGGSR